MLFRNVYALLFVDDRALRLLHGGALLFVDYATLLLVHHVALLLVDGAALLARHVDAHRLVLGGTLLHVDGVALLRLGLAVLGAPHRGQLGVTSFVVVGSALRLGA